MTFTAQETDQREAAPATRVSAVVDVDLPGPRINRHIYGHFSEHLGRCIYDGFYVGANSPIPNAGGIRLDIVEALRALDIPNLRWPGGCFADEYHWLDGVGPVERRPTMVNSHWGDIVEDNSFGTHEFLALCELLDTEPYISANVGSGTVREASEWIEYLTRGDDSPMARMRRQNGRGEPWNVKYWGLGNEPWGCGGRFSPEEYATLAKTFGTYSRQHNGNEVYRIAAGGSNDDYQWTETLMKALGRKLGSTTSDPNEGAYQAISFHYYTMPNGWNDKGHATEFDRETYYNTVAQAYRVDEILTGHANVMDVYDPAKSIGLVLDEWGTWFEVERGTNPGFLFQQNTMRDAIVASYHLDAFHRHADRLVMANIAQTVNVLQAMILTEGDAFVLTPTYHVFEMNKGHQDAESLLVRMREAPATRTAGEREFPTTSISASRKGDSVLISITNADADAELELAVELRGAPLGAPRARVLTAPELAAHNTVAAPNAVAPLDWSAVELDGSVLRVTAPRHSFMTVQIPVVG